MNTNAGVANGGGDYLVFLPYGQDRIRCFVRCRPARAGGSIAIHVEVDGRVLADLPTNASDAEMRAALMRCVAWIHRRGSRLRRCRASLNRHSEIGTHNVLNAKSGAADRPIRDQATSGNRDSSLSRVIGYSRTRMPVALWIALAMAAPTPHRPSSPTPLAFIGDEIGSVSSRKMTS